MALCFGGKTLVAEQRECWAEVPMATPVLHIRPADILGAYSRPCCWTETWVPLLPHLHPSCSGVFLGLLKTLDIGAADIALCLRQNGNYPSQETCVSFCHTATSLGGLHVPCQAASALHVTCLAFTTSRRKHYTSGMGLPLSVR